MCREVPSFFEIVEMEAALGGTRYPILRVPHQAAPRALVRSRTKAPWCSEGGLRMLGRGWARRLKGQLVRRRIEQAEDDPVAQLAEPVRGSELHRGLSVRDCQRRPQRMALGGPAQGSAPARSQLTNAGGCVERSSRCKLQSARNEWRKGHPTPMAAKRARVALVREACGLRSSQDYSWP